MAQEKPCCCPKPPWVAGTVDTPSGPVDRVSTAWSKQDARGQIWCRLSNRHRMNYTVVPGLYAVGNADRQSPVFVSANYKLSFDVLRRALDGIDGWILVLDTKGINVWCAAGKGMFGTKELVQRIRAVGLDEIIAHRRLVVPQLGATGVAAHVVKKQTGFSVAFGPVYARDIAAFIQADYAATPQMRRVCFGMRDRFELTWMELVPALKYFPVSLLVLFVLMGLRPEGIMFAWGIRGVFPMGLALLAAVVAGGFLTPVLLPFLPFRSFALKGWIAGVAVLAAMYAALETLLRQNRYYLAAVYLAFPVLSSYIAVNFTGTSTFTNPSGVRKELKIATPLCVLLVVAGLAAFVIGKLRAWGIV